MKQSQLAQGWTIAIIGLVLSIGVGLALFVNSNTTSIREALAAEVLEQQHDVATLTHEYATLLLALKSEQIDPGLQHQGDIRSGLENAQRQLLLMRSNYSFARLDGAARAHAFSKPVLEDVDQWLESGIPGHQENKQLALTMATQRLDDRYPLLREIAAETDSVAASLIATQTGFVDRFRLSLITLLGAYALVALGISAMLIRQRNLLASLADSRQHYAQRFRDFAEIGADWFWETDADLKIRNHSGDTLSSLSGSASNDAAVEHSANHTSQSEYANEETSVQIAQHFPLDQMQAQEMFRGVESNWISPDGNSHVISMNAKPVFSDSGTFLGYRGIGRDITPRKRIEEELQQANIALIAAETKGRQQAEQRSLSSEKFLRTTLDALPSNIAILDHNGVVITSNEAWNTLHTNSAAAANDDDKFDGGVGEHYLTVYANRPEGERDGINEAATEISRVLRGELDSLHHEFTCGGPNAQRWLVIRLSTFEANDASYTILIHEEITERRELEQHDRRLRSELAHVSRLTTAGEMASGLAHELNQPLTAISHNCDALLNSISDLTPAQPELTETARDIYDQAHRAGGIIRSMRQLVRKDTTRSQTVDLNELVKETVRLTHPEAYEKGISVVLNLAKDLPDPHIDPVQIQQVLVNLERNGVEAIANTNSDERELVISTQYLAPNSEDSQLQRDEGVIRVSVQDSGKGLNAALREQLFTPFRTTKANGMGLGLSISRSIVESHGGKLWIDPNLDGPTQFHFTIPIDKGEM